MSTSDQEQAVGAAPEAVDASSPAEATIPGQASKRPGEAEGRAGAAEDARTPRPPSAPPKSAGPPPTTSADPDSATPHDPAPATPAATAEPDPAAPDAGEGAGSATPDASAPSMRAGSASATPDDPGTPAEPAAPTAPASTADRNARPGQLAPQATRLADLDAESPTASDAQDEPRRGMAPWMARRVRMVAAGVLMAAMAVILVVRLATRSSVLVVGVYGIALILCGVVIELSRNGRTRLGSWLLVVGLLAAFGMDWFVLP
ncbi:hypothetical protein [Streptomyces sp. NPDC048111]|uniref:hypothetical protein n=1 Tax=Streptomyces sp. NPDC048111 TaxID=3365500 RepID=UPI003716B6C1